MQVSTAGVSKSINPFSNVIKLKIGPKKQPVHKFINTELGYLVNPYLYFLVYGHHHFSFPMCCIVFCCVDNVKFC